MRLPMNAGMSAMQALEETVPNIIANTPHLQPWSTISGKPGRYPAMPHTHLATDIISLTWSQITGAPSTFPPDAHTQDWTTVTGKPATFPPDAHGHSWGDVAGKPATYPPSDHSHPVGAPVSRSVAFATAYQATNPLKPSLVTINISLTTTVALLSPQANTVELYIGPASSVATTGGTLADTYRVDLSVSIILSLGFTSRGSLRATVPAGYFWAVRQTVGTQTSIIGAFDQTLT